MFGALEERQLLAALLMMTTKGVYWKVRLEVRGNSREAY